MTMAQNNNNYSEGTFDLTTSPKLQSIARVAQLYGLSPRALRYYEDLNLLTPVRMNNRRYYRKSDELRLQLIQKAKRLGFSLAEIGMMLSKEKNQTTLTLSKGQIEEKLKVLVNERASIDEALTDLYAALRRNIISGDSTVDI